MRITNFIIRTASEWKDASRMLDSFVREVTSVLNGGVSFQEQLKMDVKTVYYTGGDSISIKPRFITRPLTVLMLSAYLANDIATVKSGGLVTWTWVDGLVTVTDVYPLTTSARYVVTFAFVEA